MTTEKEILKSLQIIPGVGKSLARDIFDLGYRSVRELKTADPESMFRQLSLLRSQPMDRCVLYVFREAVYYASANTHKPELLKWWTWKDTNLQNIEPADRALIRATPASSYNGSHHHHG